MDLTCGCFKNDTVIQFCSRLLQHMKKKKKKKKEKTQITIQFEKEKTSLT